MSVRLQLSCSRQKELLTDEVFSPSIYPPAAKDCRPMKRYPVKMEIAGPTAMWTRPDTGDCPVSYPAPTCSAVRNIFQSILWGQGGRSPLGEMQRFIAQIS